MALPHFFESIWQFEFENIAPSDFSPVEADGHVVVCHGPLLRGFTVDGEIAWTLQESPNMATSSIFERTERSFYFEYTRADKMSVLVEADHRGSFRRDWVLGSRIQRFGSAQADDKLAFISSSKMGSSLHVMNDEHMTRHLLGFPPHGLAPAPGGWIVRNQFKGAVFVNEDGDIRELSNQPTWDCVTNGDGHVGLLTGTNGAYQFTCRAPDGAELRTFDVSSPFATLSADHVIIVTRKGERAWLAAIDWRGEIAWETELGDVDNYRLWAAAGWVGVTRVGGFQMFQSDDGSLVAESRLAWAAPLVLDGVCFWNGSSTVIATTMNPSD